MPSSVLIFGAAWHAGDEGSHRSEHLEEAQSPAEERWRSAMSGTEAELTELAAPKPAAEVEYGDDLEKEEARLSSHDHRGKSMHNKDNELTEVASPEPVARRPEWLEA